MIPARMGSTRLAKKNLALAGGKPLIYYAIKAAKDSGVFDRIIVNAEDDIFAGIAKRYGVEFYKRPGHLASSTAKSDPVVYDFIAQRPCDIVAWVNTIAPLQTGRDIRDVVRYFVNNALDSLITVKNEQVHCLHKGRPVNFTTKGLFAQTQDLAPVQPFVYSVMMWRTEPFREAFEKHGCAFFCGRSGFYPVGKLASMIIKTKEDLALADYMLRTAKRGGAYKVRYDRSVKRRGR